MQHFAYTGTTAQFTIPIASNGFRFFIWGAGGGTSTTPTLWFPSYGGYGGAGGFVTGTFDTGFQPGDTIEVEVGRAGRRADQLAQSWENAWLDGGQHCTETEKSYWAYDFIPAGGGGSSRIYKTGTDAEADPLAVAGAGGGAGCAIEKQNNAHGGHGGMVVDTRKRGGQGPGRFAARATTSPYSCLTASGGGGYKGGGFTYSTTRDGWYEYWGGGGGTSFIHPTATTPAWEDSTAVGVAPGTSYKNMYNVPSSTGDRENHGYVLLQGLKKSENYCQCDATGYIPNAESTACIPCPESFYCPITSDTPNEVMPCPLQMTSPPASTNQTDCYCNTLGTYGPVTGSTTCSYCTSSGESTYCP
eukprot:254246-Rhodomonas_salina.1